MTILISSVWYSKQGMIWANISNCCSRFSWKSHENLFIVFFHNHYSDVTMGAMASKITGVSIVYSIVGSGAVQRKHQSSASLVFVRRILRWPVNSPHKGPVTRKMITIDDVIMMLLADTPTPTPATPAHPLSQIQIHRWIETRLYVDYSTIVPRGMSDLCWKFNLMKIHSCALHNDRQTDQNLFKHAPFGWGIYWANAKSTKKNIVFNIVHVSYMDHPHWKLRAAVMSTLSSLLAP